MSHCCLRWALIINMQKNYNYQNEFSVLRTLPCSGFRAMGLFVASSQMIHIVYFLFQMGLWHHMLAYLSSRARSSLGYKQKFMRRGPCFSFFVYQSKVVAAYNTCLPRLPEYLIIHDILGPTWCISPGLLNANKA